MSGHSKWSTIKRKKEKTDNARAKVFTKIGREIAVVVREGGPDPASNSKLKDVIAKAKANNVPNDNIERIIKKAAGEDSDKKYEEIVYEGYGPKGIAVIVEALTDNRNRTAGDVRHYFDKYGGNMGQSGSVSFMFTKQGVIILEQDGIYEIRTDPYDCGAVSSALADKGYTFLSADVAYIPSNYVALTDPDDITAMGKMLEMFEDNDDIQGVWHNWENADDAE